MTTRIRQRAIPPARDAANRPTIDALSVAVNEMSGAIGAVAARAVRVGELLDAGVLRMNESMRLVPAFIVDTITPGDTTHAPSGDAVNTALAGKASTGANTFTGNQTIQNSGSPTLNIVSTGAGSALCNLDSQAGTLAAFNFKTNGSNRWVLTKGSTAELGGNVGTDFELRAHTDAGAFNFRAFTLKRESGDILWGRDNLQNCGGPSNRLKEVWCGNNVINTSDAREKTPLRPLDDTELAIARDIAGIVGIYQWLAAVAEKGEGGARLHCGAIAQEVIAAFEAHGRDAFRYGIVCYDAWSETREPATDDSPEVIHPAGDRYSLRYGELAMFLIAGQEARMRALEAAL